MLESSGGYGVAIFKVRCMLTPEPLWDRGRRRLPTRTRRTSSSGRREIAATSVVPTGGAPGATWGRRLDNAVDSRVLVQDIGNPFVRIVGNRLDVMGHQHPALVGRPLQDLRVIGGAQADVRTRTTSLCSARRWTPTRMARLKFSSATKRTVTYPTAPESWRADRPGGTPTR